MKNRIEEIGYNNQGEKIIIIAYRNANDIDIQFEDGAIVYNRGYDKFKMGRIKHPIRYEESFAYHIEIELGLNLDDIWNWEKNNKNGINPYEISKQSNKKVWLYCLKHDYHNYDREGNKIGYKITCNDFYRGRRCSYCKKSKKVHYKDSLAYNYPNITKMIAIEENNLTFDDCYEIAPFSNKSFYFKCLDCESISEKKYKLNQITNYGFSCKLCSDGISIPNKFMTNILKQLNEDFTTELNKSDFEWCGYFKYDFYLPKHNMIIEVNGLQHYEENTNFKRSLEQEQMNDLFKYKCAKGRVNDYIVIDCRYSTLEWIKENIIKELSYYFDLSQINWELAWEESQNSLCVKAWELWNEGLCVNDIVNKLNSNRTTIRKYLKQGEKCKKCNYSIENSRKIAKEKIKGKDNPNSKQVICITTGKIFNTIVEASGYYYINRGHISDCCKMKRKSCGKLKDGTKLIWMYYEDYLKQMEETDEI